MAEEFGPNLGEAIQGDIRVQFTEDSFNEALQKFGAENLASALTQRASALLPTEYQFTYDDLKSGEAKFLDQTAEFRDMTKEQRQQYFRSPEAVFSLFSNVEDYGKYDPTRRTQPGMEALAEEYARKLPTGVGMMEGLLLGAKGGQLLSTKIPPTSPQAVLARLGLYGASTLAGSAIGAYLGEEVSEAGFGPRKPISPSLQAHQNFGETLSLATNPISSLTQPFRWTTDKNWLGASQFLENFRNVNKGNWKNYGNSFLLTAKSANLSPKYFDVAQNAAEGRNVLKGEFFDPSKGPVGMRVLSGFEKAIPAAREFAYKHPYVTVGLDLVSATGAAGGAYGAELAAPGSEGTRFLFEMAGAALPGPVAEAGVRLSAKAGRPIVDAIKKFYTDKGAAVTTAREEEAMNRILTAIESTQGEIDANDLEILNNVLLAEAALVESGQKPASNVSLTAIEAESPIGPALAQIDDTVQRTLNELSVSSEKGKQAWIQAAKQKIVEFANSGDPTLVKTSAILSKQLFEETLIGDMRRRVDNLYNALEKVTKGDAKKLEKYGVSELMYERLKGFVDDSWRLEKDFWNGVGNFEITEFRNANGDVVDLPNTVSIFDRPSSQGGLNFASDTGEATFWQNTPKGMRQDLTTIFRFFGRNLDGSPIEASEAADATAAVSPAMNKAYKAYQDAQDKIRGSSDERLLTSYEERASELGFEERLQYLRDQASSLRQRASNREFDDNQSARNLATAIDRLANLEVVKNRDAADEAFRAGAIDPSDMENPMTASRLMEMRSKLLEAAANLRTGVGKRGSSDTANKLDRLSNAILQDLVSQDTDSVAYNQARAFTLARRDITERTFLGDLIASDTLGRNRLGAENALDFMFGRGSDAVVRRMNELELANKFIKTEMGMSEDAANDYTGNINQAVANAYRWTMSKITSQKPDPTDPNKIIDVVDPKKYDAFMADPANQKILGMFPNIAKDLKSAEKAQRALSAIDPKKFFAENETYRALSLAADMGGETPQVFVANVLSEPNPFNSLNNILNTIENQQKVRVLRNGDLKVTTKPRTTILDGESGQEFSVDDAKEGLRAAIMNYAVMRGGNEGALMSPKRVFEVLFIKPPKVKDSNNTLMNWMKKNNIITEDESNLVRQHLKEMINVEEAFQNNRMDEVIFKRPTQQKRFFAKALGATLGQRGQEQLNNILSKIGIGTEGGGIGAGMVAAREGSIAAEDALLTAPEMAIAKTMQAILNNPKKFAPLMLEIQNKRQLAAANRTFGELLTEIGVNQITKRDQIILRSLLFPEQQFEPVGLEEETVTEEPASPVTAPVPNPDDEASLRALPTSPPVAQPRPVAAPAPVPQTTPPSPQPAARSRYAALFPNDPISGMISQGQGIGSLL
jgi:hypothetical protein